MSDRSACESVVEDRLVDCLIEEVEGHGPPPELERRVLAALVTRVAPAPAPRRASRLAVAAAALLAVGVVVAIAVRQRQGAGAASSTAAPQEPSPRSVEELLRELASTDATRSAAAAAALTAAGARAVPALTAAIADPVAPRVAILEVLDEIGPAAAPALAAIAELVLAEEAAADLQGPACRAVATLVPFAAPEAQLAARRAVLITAFVRDGGSGPGKVALGGKAPRRSLSLREVGRMLHRSGVPTGAPTEQLLQHLAGESPFARELAAQLLGEHPGSATVAALREALVSSNPTEVSVEWLLEEGYSGNYTFHQEHDGAVHLAAARSLARLAGATGEGAIANAFLLEHGSASEQRVAAANLARDVPPAADRASVTAALVRALDREDVTVLREVVTAVGLTPPSGERLATARQRLERLAGHEDAQIAARAKATLRLLQ